MKTTYKVRSGGLRKTVQAENYDDAVALALELAGYPNLGTLIQVIEGDGPPTYAQTTTVLKRLGRLE